MTDEKKRRNAGFIGSALIHILIVLVISFTGLLHFSSNTEDIVEVTFFGGGGGGGNGAEAAIVNDRAAGEESTSVEKIVQDNNDAILEASKDIPPSSPSKHKAAAVKSKGSSASTGTGYGSGRGSGTGPGFGSGSGGGHGSGHGTGTGSGYGEGTGVTPSPAVPPRIIKSYQPSYPSAERNAGIEGTVVIRFLIDQNGNVEDVTLINSSGNANFLMQFSHLFLFLFVQIRRKQFQRILHAVHIAGTLLRKHPHYL